MTATFSGQPSAGDSGGRNVAFSSFSPTSWAKLFWGSSSSALPKASLNGGAGTTLAFVGGAGTNTATWQSNVSWTNPSPPGGTFSVPVKMTVTITAGGLLWANATSIPGLDPGPGAGMGVAVTVANGGTATNFTANVKFEADIPTDAPTGFIPLNNVQQGTGGNTVSSFTGAFYSKP